MKVRVPGAIVGRNIDVAKLIRGAEERVHKMDIHEHEVEHSLPLNTRLRTIQLATHAGLVLGLRNNDFSSIADAIVMLEQTILTIGGKDESSS